MAALELELAAAATTLAVGFFRRVLEKPSNYLADEAARRVVTVLENLGRSDLPAHSALETLRHRPDDSAAQQQLEQRIEQTARHNSVFREDLRRSMPEMNVRDSVNMVSGQGFAVNNIGQSARVSWKNVTRKSGAGWLVAGAAVVVLILLLTCGGIALAFGRGQTTLFDTKTNLESAGGWSYRVSEAHLKTSPQLEGRGPAKPGYNYLYFDITVENRLDDRQAPGVEFHFARAAGTLTENCGATSGGWLGPMSSYAAGIVTGWCISKNDAILGGGASCFETNDSFFHSVDNLPPGGKNQIRCVDSYLVSDDFDLNSLRVYYLGGDIILNRTDFPNMKQIPTAT